MSKVISYYNQFDEWGRLEREPVEFLINWHYIQNYLPENGTVLDNGAGPGKYSMELARAGFRVTLADLTPKFADLAKEKAQEFGLTSQFDDFLAADARNLSMLKDNQFDVSLMLGPLYHLQEEQDRIQAVRELRRVTKKGGVVFAAFMPRARHMLTALQHPENWQPLDKVNSIEQFSETGCFHHANDGRFTNAYYFNIEEITPFMESQGFESLQLIGSNPGAILTGDSWSYWRGRGEEEQVIQMLIDQAADPYLLGISPHLLYIGRKR
ncbi:methyltransferase domain-containing protein [Bacillus mangrovi]|uniref:Methyltransferase domain-containing protein n=1 Tax=Metabacillus mangrovi TaxID=1491830 RepID=A0A7X2S4G6_9BACI|nr:class I SAM-dependent methyltransferase [Metabacillus mangrovi]MTH53523.1 methyltransferase domain-containing protein [Metabacillus mangrovi]